MLRFTRSGAFPVRRQPFLLLPFLCAVLCGPPASGSTSMAMPAWPDPGGITPPPAPVSTAPPADSRRGPLARSPRARQAGTWKALILIYRNMDVTSGTSHWTSAMTDAQVAMLQDACANFAYIASSWSGSQGSVSPTIRVVDRPLSTLTSVFTSYYWLRPEDVEPELAAELAIAPEPFDSVIVLWDSGAVPTNYWGLAYVGPIGWGAYQFTWSTVIRGQDWYWSRNDAPGEVILHEWLHGLEGHYRNYGYVVPDLHGAEEHGYKEDAVGGWRTWLRDYMQGRVVKDGWTRGISPGVWGSGAVNNLVRPAPIQLLAPLSGTQTVGSPTLIWAGPGQSFRARLTNTADLSPAYEAYTAASQMVPSSIPLHPNSQYRWQVVSRSGATESPAPEWKYFRYAGPGVPYNANEVAWALQVAAGALLPGVNEIGRLNVETSGPSAGRVDQADAARLARKVTGLDANP